MKRRDFTISLIIAFAYWIPSSIVLPDIIRGSGMIFPEWLETILMPGYLPGFALGYVGGGLWAMVGQSVELIIIFLIVRMIYKPFRRKIYKDDKK
jgi:hypothetical protein